jgi:hypothetical protein
MKTKLSIIVAAAFGLAGIANAEEKKPNHDRGNRVDHPGGPGHPDRPLPPEIVKKFDKDGDGKLSEEEREAAKESLKKEMLTKFDKDGDGELSDEEREAAKKERMEKHEASKKEMLKKFDTNGDGELNDQEKEAMKKAMQEHRAKRGGPGGFEKRKEKPAEGGKEAPGVLGE